MRDRNPVRMDNWEDILFPDPNPRNRTLPTRNVVLTEHQADLIARLVTSGRYQNTSEVMCEGLRLVERQEAEEEVRLKAMREAADAGITDVAAGRFRTFDPADALEEHLSAVSDRALADLSSDITAGP